MLHLCVRKSVVSVMLGAAPGLAWFTLLSGCVENERKYGMTKSIETMEEAIRNVKHPFRKAQHHSKKSLKNRHERRKIKEYLHLGDWLAEEMV